MTEAAPANPSIHFLLAVQTSKGVKLSAHAAAQPCTVQAAVHALGVNTAGLTLGVWGRSAKAGQTLKNGDRIELYLPLLADPKDARRARVNRSISQQAAKENAANRAARAMRKLQQATTPPNNIQNQQDIPSRST